MKIDVVGEGFHRGANFRRRTYLQGRAEMQLADFDVVFPEPGNDFAGFLEFHGQMAGVIVHAEMLAETRVIRMVGAQSLKKFRRLFAGFQIANWLRLQSEMQFFGRALAHTGDVLDAAPKIVPHRAFLLLRPDELLERTGNGADAALDA